MKTTRALALGVLLALTLTLGLWMVLSKTADETPAAPLTEAAPEPSPSVSTAFLDEDPAPSPGEQGPGVPEWAEDSYSEGSYVERHRAALISEDWEEVEEAFRNLVRHLEEHPEDFAEITAALQSDPDLIRNLDVFAAAPLASFAAAPAFEAEFELKARILTGPALALATEHDNPEIRAIGLSVLGRFPVEDAAVVDLAARAAREGQRSEIESGVAALASWVYQNSPLREQITGELARATAGLDCEELWPRAVQAMVMAHGGIPDPLAGALTDYLDADPSPHRYARVARTLSAVNEESRPFAMELYGTAFLGQSDPTVQEMILTELVEIGGADTVAWARELSLDEETLTSDARDYLEILRSGVAEIDEIRNLKALRDIERELSQSDGEME